MRHNYSLNCHVILDRSIIFPPTYLDFIYVLLDSHQTATLGTWPYTVLHSAIRVLYTYAPLCYLTHSGLRRFECEQVQAQHNCLL